MTARRWFLVAAALLAVALAAVAASAWLVSVPLRAAIRRSTGGRGRSASRPSTLDAVQHVVVSARDLAGCRKVDALNARERRELESLRRMERGGYGKVPF